MPVPRILAFAGSSRSASFNKLLVAVAAGGARDAGADVTCIDLRDYPLPLYDGDLEASSGLPAPALALKALMGAHQGLLIAAPEYNSSLTALLKNTIDWCSRPAPGEPPLAAFQNQVAGLLSASPGALGGMRGLIVLRMLLGNLRMLVLPGQCTIAHAHQAFGPTGELLDPKLQEQARGIGRELVRTVRALSTPAA